MGRWLLAHVAGHRRRLRRGSPVGLLAVVVVVAGIVLGPGALRAFADEPASTLPELGSQGPARTYDPTRMQPNSVGDDRCSGEIAGWEMANPSDGEFGARRLEGEVVIGHPPHGDAFFNQRLFRHHVAGG